MTYQNPVYPKSFPDPFVLKYCGEYWAYCTGTWTDGRWFGVLRSRNLVDWEAIGGALEPLPGEWPCQWAPEVSYLNGVFICTTASAMRPPCTSALQRPRIRLGRSAIAGAY